MRGAAADGTDGCGGVALDEAPGGVAGQMGLVGAGAEDGAAVGERIGAQVARAAGLEDMPPAAALLARPAHGVADAVAAVAGGQPGDRAPEWVDDADEVRALAGPAGRPGRGVEASHRAYSV